MILAISLMATLTLLPLLVLWLCSGDDQDDTVRWGWRR